jgi:Lon protease-like protein
VICWTDGTPGGYLKGVAIMAMFPLNSVLFPYMPLRLRVFEERYLIMLAELLRSEDARFGVVLIERGREVGGGEECFSLGTVADITQLGAQEGFVGLVAQGSQRFEVIEWIDDTLHPCADVRAIAELEWDDSLWRLRNEAEQLVRRTLAVASEFAENVWPSDVELSANPVAAAWQLAAISPLSALDQLALLGSTSFAELLVRVSELTYQAGLTFDAPWPDNQTE